MARRVRYHTSFSNDLTERVAWLRENSPSQYRTTLRNALAVFKERIGAYPGLGEQIELRGTRSYRVFTIGGGLPYLVWYYYDITDEDAPVWFAMLMHEHQDRERFKPEPFE